MAVVLEDKRVAVAIKLNNGTDSEGNIKTVSTSLGTLSTSGFDAQKAQNIINALAPCLSKVVYSRELTQVKYMSDSGD